MTEQNATLIRRPLLTGHQPIDGLWLSAERFCEAERARQILIHWQPGASAHRFAEGDLLRWREPRSVQCERLSGWPLVRQGGTLCSARLEPQERQSLPAADVWLVRGSRVSALHLQDATPLAPGQWLDIGGYTLHDTYDCRSVLPQLAPQPLAVVSDVREILGGALKPVSAQQAAIMKALQERKRGAGEAAATRGEGAVKQHREFPEALRSFWSKTGLVFMLVLTLGVFRPGLPFPGTGSQPVDPLAWVMIMLIGGVLLATILMRFCSVARRTSGSAVVSSARAVQPSPSIAARREPARHKPAAWRRWLTRLTQGSHLAKLYGQRQAAYLQRLLDMFEEGDLEEALRHAIPLGGAQGPVEQSFGTPQRRDALKLGTPNGSGRAMLFEEDMDAHLRKLYQQTFERLDREGRIEEAVFVLAELLKAHQQALDYLEKHGRHQQAAELALAWDMPAPVIVRLFCLADDWQQAVRVARRDNAFDAAVTQLQTQWPEAADRLREEWAHSLVAKGLWLEAVDVIWPVPAQRKHAAQWLLKAEAAGGRLAMGALVKRAILLPQTLEDYGPWVEQLRDDATRVNERRALAEALLAQKAESDRLRWLAGAMAQAIIVDQASGDARLTHNQLLALVKMSGDKLLMADMPAHALKRPPVQALSAQTRALEWTAPEQGNPMILDAVPLEDQRYLVALGESGAMVVDATGKRVFHFAVPAMQIVLSHSRRLALVLMRRDALWRVAKLDLVSRTSTDLGVLQLDVFAKTFDGVAWTIGRGSQLRVVDVHQGFETLWQVADLPGVVCGVRSDARNEYVWVAERGAGSEIWHYRLPERRLARREPVPARAPSAEGYTFEVFGAHPEMSQFELKLAGEEPAILVLQQAGSRKGYRLPDLDEGIRDELVEPWVFDEWLVVRYTTSTAPSRLHFINRSSDVVCAVLEWPRHAVSFREVGDDWLLFDDQGRLCHIDVAHARQRRITLR